MPAKSWGFLCHLQVIEFVLAHFVQLFSLLPSVCWTNLSRYLTSYIENVFISLDIITFTFVVQGENSRKYCFSSDIKFPKGQGVPSFYLSDLILNVQGPAHSKCSLLSWMKNPRRLSLQFLFSCFWIIIGFPPKSPSPHHYWSSPYKEKITKEQHKRLLFGVFFESLNFQSLKWNSV